MKNQNFHFEVFDVDPLVVQADSLIGQGNKDVLVIHQASGSSEDCQELLTKILSAINLQIENDAFRYQMPTDSTVSLIDLVDSKNIKNIIAFGCEPKALSLHINKILYQTINLRNVDWIFADELAKVKEDKMKKKLLWEALKTLNIE